VAPEEAVVGEVLDATGDGRDAAVQRAVDALRAGELVVLPTDTVYGLAADAFSLEGTARLFRVKGADRGAPLTVFVRSPKQLAGLTSATGEVADRLVAAYWPGPLTLVLPAEPNLRWDLGATEGTVAVRMPLDDVALAVVRAVGPVAVTSANLAGRQPPPPTVAVVADLLGEDVACYLDDGPRAADAPSTIVDLTRREPVVLRAGALPTDEVLAVARGELDPFRIGEHAASGEPATDGDHEGQDAGEDDGDDAGVTPV
jgi:L-threonylcarbamoyladenylate synthase